MFQKLLKLTYEENFINRLIFSEEKMQKIDFLKINYESFTKISSKSLILPLVYSCLKRKKYLKYIPDEFNQYLKYIHQINKNRNVELIKEVFDLSQLLKQKKIIHVFIKGSAYLNVSKLKDLGYRMVGDIDLLIRKKDLSMAVKLCKSNGYYELDTKKNLPYDYRHYHRMINEKKLFALEIHTDLIQSKKRYLLETKNVFDSIIYENNIPTLSKENQRLNIIYKQLFNDEGILRAEYNYRNLYDFVTIEKDLKTNELFKNKYTKTYHNLMYSLGIKKTPMKFSFMDLILIYRIILKRNNNFLWNLDKILSKILLISTLLTNKIKTLKKYKKIYND